MGCGKQFKTRTQITMAEEKKSLINTCKNAFKWLKRGKGKTAKELKTEKNVKNEEIVIIEPLKVTPVAVLLEKLEKEKREQEDDEEDEFKQFTHKIIDDEPRVSIESQSSVDSGFTEKGTDNEKDTDLSEKETDDLTDKLKELKVDAEKQEEKSIKKIVQTVRISRGPVKTTNFTLQSKSHPYTVQKQSNHGFRQTQNLGHVQSQINTQALCGGNLIVNPVSDTEHENNYLAQAVNEVEQSVEKFTTTTVDEQELNLTLANEFISKELNTIDFYKAYSMNPLSPSMNDDLNSFAPFSPETVQPQHNQMHYNSYDPTLSQLNYVDDYQSLYQGPTFPTPPRSENVPSPMSDSFLQTSSDYTLSPPTSSPMRNLNLEICQQLIDYADVEEELPKTETKKEDVSHNMKYYKDLQKELSNKFSKMECCQKNRRTCREILREHMQRLQKDERARINLKVAMMEPRAATAVLQFLIEQISTSTTIEDRQVVIFCLVCDRILMEKPSWFAEDFGLELIKLAVLRCYSTPFITRYLVECTRIALKKRQQEEDSLHVFKELDAQGDNLLHACVRKGDVCGEVLGELVRAAQGERPLFNVEHSNSDGYSALHLACIMHSAAEPRLHLAHVLMEHAGADLWQMDVKGGDTALHLAVNSPHCDLNLVMVLFNHFPRSEWKELAKAPNRSSVSARDYARSASRSSSRPNYPPEVLEFLKKCR